METAARPYAFIKFDKVIQRKRKEFLDPQSRNNMARLNDDLADIHNIMKRNIEEVLNRGERLDRECIYIFFNSTTRFRAVGVKIVKLVVDHSMAFSRLFFCLLRFFSVFCVFCVLCLLFLFSTRVVVAAGACRGFFVHLAYSCGRESILFKAGSLHRDRQSRFVSGCLDHVRCHDSTQITKTSN